MKRMVVLMMLLLLGVLGCAAHVTKKPEAKPAVPPPPVTTEAATIKVPKEYAPLVRLMEAYQQSIAAHFRSNLNKGDERGAAFQQAVEEEMQFALMSFMGLLIASSTYRRRVTRRDTSFRTALHHMVPVGTDSLPAGRAGNWQRSAPWESGCPKPTWMAPSAGCPSAGRQVSVLYRRTV